MDSPPTFGRWNSTRTPCTRSLSDASAKSGAPRLALFRLFSFVNVRFLFVGSLTCSHGHPMDSRLCWCSWELLPSHRACNSCSYTYLCDMFTCPFASLYPTHSSYSFTSTSCCYSNTVTVCYSSCSGTEKASNGLENLCSAFHFWRCQLNRLPDCHQFGGVGAEKISVVWFTVTLSSVLNCVLLRYWISLQ